MKRLVWLILPIALVIPGIARADSDGYFCLGPGYIAYQFGMAGPSARLHWIFIVRYEARGISELDSIQLPQFQVHGMRCQADAVDVAAWDAIHTVTLDSLRRPLSTRAVPLSRPGDFPPWTRGPYPNLRILPSLARGTLAPYRQSLHLGPNGDEYVLEIAADADSIRQCPPAIRARIVQFNRDGREIHSRVCFADRVIWRHAQHLGRRAANSVPGLAAATLGLRGTRWGCRYYSALHRSGRVSRWPRTRRRRRWIRDNRPHGCRDGSHQQRLGVRHSRTCTASFKRVCLVGRCSRSQHRTRMLPARTAWLGAGRRRRDHPHASWRPIQILVSDRA